MPELSIDRRMVLVRKCTRCGLSDFRRKRVVGRGSVPASILFIGEAPGKSEDLLGKPFVGPSGRLLNQGIKDASELCGVLPSYYITNVIQCRPTDWKGGDNREPTEKEAWECRSNLENVVRAVQPIRVVLIGKVAQTLCTRMFPGASKLVHPAYLLRRGGTPSPEYRAFVTELTHIFEEVDHAKES